MCTKVHEMPRVQGFSELPHASKIKFPDQPYNYVEKVWPVLAPRVFLGRCNDCTATMMLASIVLGCYNQKRCFYASVSYLNKCVSGQVWR